MKRPDTLIEVAETAMADRRAMHFPLAGFPDAFDTVPDARADLLAPRPPMTGHDVTDAYLGAVAEHLGRRGDVAIPAWVEEPGRFLRRPVFASSIEELKALLLAQSPLAFRRRMLFVEHEPLRRARMPRPAAPMPPPRR